jgi:type II secretory pathway pseudopilin PulG
MRTPPPVGCLQQRRQGGVSRFEFAVVVAILAILAGVLLERLAFYHEQAELVAMQQVAANIRTALDVQTTQAQLPGRSVDLAQLAGQNPIALLDRKPANYLGEYFSPNVAELPAGNWYFDRHDKTLIYLLNNRESFGNAPAKLLKFKVKLLRLPTKVAKPSGASEAAGVTFEQVND